MERLRGCVMGMLLFWFAGAAPAAAADGPARLDGGRTAARAPLSHILVAQTDATREFNIPAQALEDAVASFGLQAGRQISMDSQLGAGLSSQPVQGTYAPEEALNRLLQGTGLSYRTDGTTMVLEKAPPLPDLPPARSQETVPPSPSTAEAAKPQQKPVKVPEILVKDVREKDDDTKSYVAEEATTATRTDTPIIQVPQSVEVVTRKVMDDQKAIRLDQALRNVSGVVSPDASRGVFNDRSFCRGFVCGVFKNNMRNLDQQQVLTYRDIANIQRVEVLKGPPSVLYGRSEPSGIVNIVTKQPLRESYASLETVFGSYGLYRPMIDVSGPMNESKTLRFRINGAYENAESFRDIVRSHRYFISPVVTWDAGSNTSLTFEGEYVHNNQTFDPGIPIIGRRAAPIPITRFLGESFNTYNVREVRAGFLIKHRFSDDLHLESQFRIDQSSWHGVQMAFGGLLADNQTLTRINQAGGATQGSYYWRNDLIGSFATGTVKHKTLTGFEIGRNNYSTTLGAGLYPSINIYNPIYGQATFVDPRKAVFVDTFSNSIGAYVQDQIDLTDSLHLLVGARGDYVYQHSGQGVFAPKRDTTAENFGFSPRVGLTYQPIQPVAVYANVTRSFNPTFTATGEANNLFIPETATQYEAGIKADVVPGRLTSNVAVYRILKQHVLATDPGNPLLQIQTGAQRSQGVEFDLTAQLTRAWKLIATYAYTDARITADTTFNIGNRLPLVARHTGSLWTTYDFQYGPLQGFGVGTGLFAVGERSGDLANTFELPGYVRVDAALYYRRPEVFARTNLTAQLNVQNLLDQEYYYGGAAIRSSGAFPGAPLTVLGSLKLEYY